MSDIRTIFKPHRGKKSTFTTGDKSSTILESGEIFFEYPDNGPGAGRGRIMMGDGSSTYATMSSNNKYFIPFTEDEIINHPGTSDKTIGGTSYTASTTIDGYINNAKSGNSLKNIIHNLREAIYSNACNIAYLNSNKLSTSTASTTYQTKLTNPLTKSDVIDNLTTTTTNVPLSANQGKVLNGKFSSYSLTTHNHDSSYAAKSHNHSGTYVSDIYMGNKAVNHTMKNAVISPTVTTNIAVSGYTPVGVVGWYNGSGAHIFVNSAYLNGNNLCSAIRRANNDATSGTVSITFYILYYKK
jgi:hypothetical protein